MTAAATFTATLFDEWALLGLTDVVIAPGSRSTPLALAAVRDDRWRTHIFHDERVAAFAALGMGLRGQPAVLVCTSGTAAANFFPAIVEAGLSDIPMIVCTADRPPELRGVGSPQTIDQINLYGSSVRAFVDLDVPEDSDPSSWRQIAGDAFDVAKHGPVHLNMPFREPLTGAADALPARSASASSSVARSRATSDFPASAQGVRGIIVMGGRSGEHPTEIIDLADRLGWPLLADPLSLARGHFSVIVNYDSVLRHVGFSGAHRPDVVIRVGRPPSSKVLTTWIVESKAPVVQVGGPGLIDPDANVIATCSLDQVRAALGSGWQGATGTRWADTWLRSWREADARAEGAIRDLLAAPELSEPTVARIVAEFLPVHSSLVVSSSMPVRDLEWYGGHHARAYANRGANGIDGVLSTAVGHALATGPVVVLIGDIAFCHDSNALIGLVDRAVDLRIVVVDNDGGGIFSFLPQAGALDTATFERVFGTPHGTDICTLAGAYGVRAVTVDDRDGLQRELLRTGPSVIRVPSNRKRNTAVHDLLVEEVRRALG